MTAVPAIELRAVVKRFGDVAAVDDVSLEVRQGEFFSLLGPSGCGKTTTLRMMAGFEFPDAGTVALDGRDVTLVPANKRAVNLVFQRYELFPHMSVAENVGYGLRLKRVPKAEIRKRVLQMLEIVGVGGLEARGAAQLSGGQQQRVALARALVNQPRVLLLDEPLSALDVKLRQRMQLELKSIQSELGTTFVYVTHDQEEALLLSDRVGIMSEGRLLQVGTPRDVYERPAHAFVADFVGTLNDLHLTVHEVHGATCIARPDGDDVVVLPTVLALGSSVRAAVRPERVRLRFHLDDVPPADTRLRGEVADVLYLGAVTKYVIQTSVGLLTVQAPSDDLTREFVTGQKIAVTWPLDALLVLHDDV